MSDSPPAPIPAPGQPLRRSLALRFSLDHDKADPAAIDASLRAGAELTGANAWILIFAIFIASIGLNVNSTAVVIGAMLVSPLMGPIMGIGYGVGIYDFALIRRSSLNLGIAGLISLATSTVYFLISPLTEAQSELLARTTPTLWDVLIALFGGFAGIVGATRREKSNVIPGVAIATALMPPLCTAGYGLAKGTCRSSSAPSTSSRSTASSSPSPPSSSSPSSSCPTGSTWIRPPNAGSGEASSWWW